MLLTLYVDPVQQSSDGTLVIGVTVRGHAMEDFVPEMCLALRKYILRT